MARRASAGAATMVLCRRELEVDVSYRLIAATLSSVCDFPHP